MEKIVEINANYIRPIFNTVPLSYYIGRKVDCELSETEPGSYWDFKSDKVIISAPCIINMLDKIESINHLEECIRSITLHEMAHIIWSGTCIYGDEKGMNIKVLNVFEDEFIETKGRDYFMGVNFRRNVILLNNYRGEEPTDAFSNFYWIVRFRHGKEKYLARVDQIINKYWDRNSSSEYEMSNYRTEIIDFFKETAKDFYEENKKDEILNQDPDYDSESEYEQNKTIDKMLEKEAQKRSESGEGGLAGEDSVIIITNDSPWKSDKETLDPDNIADKIKNKKVKILKQNDDGTLSELSESELDKLVNQANRHNTPHESDKKDEGKFNHMMSSKFNKLINNDLTEKFRNIISTFNKRNKDNHAAMARYSGQFDPRLVATHQDDYRWWKYKSENGPIKGFSKMKLTLYVDVSGSMGNNQLKVNQILKSLDAIEKDIDFFSYDVVAMGVGERIVDRKERYLRMTGGNYVDDKIFGIVKKMQDPRALNYGIVLADGDLFTDCRTSLAQAQKNLGAFNSSHFSIISDSDNEKYLTKYCPSAKVKIVRDGGRSKSYADLLFDNVVEALNKVLL